VVVYLDSDILSGSDPNQKAYNLEVKTYFLISSQLTIKKKHEHFSFFNSFPNLEHGNSSVWV
jgi:hypothetical protein